MKKISCIIPAYNEEKNIWNILKILTSLKDNSIYEIIVINDCSSDNTEKIVKKYSKVFLINNNKNLWKSKSVAKAIEKSKWDYIFLLDADLLNLSSENIYDFTSVILDNSCDVVFAFIKNSWPLFPFKEIDYCTGQRILSKKILLENIKKMKSLPSYWLEVFMNNIIIKNNLRLKVIPWPNVENDFHQNRLWFIKWWKRNFKIWRDIIKISGSIVSIYKMNFRLRKLLVKDSCK